jgi:prophage antirepressor-like protein
MTTAIQLFSFEGHEVRITDREGNPWWVLADVCAALGIANSRDCADRLDADEKNTVALNDGIRGNPNKTIVNESGLYNVILRSDKPEAKRFRKWVTSEVLPSIRKTGGYGNTDKIISLLDRITGILENQDTRLAVLESRPAPRALPAPRQPAAPRVKPMKDYYDGVRRVTNALRGASKVVNLSQVLGLSQQDIAYHARKKGLPVRQLYNRDEAERIVRSYVMEGLQ